MFTPPPCPATPARLWPLLLLLTCATAAAQTRSVVGELAVSTDLTDRGIVVGPRQPVVQALVTLYDTAGWSTGLAIGVQDTHQNPHQILARAAYDWVVSNTWQAQASALYYGYPSSPQLQSFDRLELGTAWSYRDVLVLGLSANQYRHPAPKQEHQYPAPNQERPQWAADLTLRWPLGGQVALSAGIGQAQLSGSGGYGYGNLGLAWRQGQWRAELSYLTTDERARTLFGSGAAQHGSFLLARTF